MEDMEWKGSISRIKKCTFDLLLMEDDLLNDDDDISWELMGRDLSLKSTFLYCDLIRVISSTCDDCKKLLTDLASRLFYLMEELSHAVKHRNISLAQVHYYDATAVMQDVMATLTATSQCNESYTSVADF